MVDRREFIKGATIASVGLSLGAKAAGLVASTPSDDRRTIPEACMVDMAVNGSPLFDTQEALKGGLQAIVYDLPIYPRTFDNAVHSLARLSPLFESKTAAIKKILKAKDFASTGDEKKVGFVLACQDASILDASTASVNDYNLQNLRLFYELGLRVLQLTHNERNSLGDSFRERSNAGLSELGLMVVGAMNDMGMIIDLSHCGDKTTEDAIAASKMPCAITHAGCRAVTLSPRNKTDDQIRALAVKGGVFGVYSMSLWLTEASTTSMEDFLAHINHAVKVAGIDHVGFGSDGAPLGNSSFEEEELTGMQAYAKRNLGKPGAERVPSHIRIPELNGPDRLSKLAAALAKNGYKAPEIDKLCGGNFVRLFEEICG